MKKKNQLTDKQKKFLIAYGDSFNIAGACREIGISRITYYRWRREIKEFDDRVKAVEETYVDLAEKTLFHTLKYGYKTNKSGEVIKVENENGELVPLYSKEAIDSAKFILSRKGKNRGYTEQIDIGADIKAMQNKLLAKEEIIDITPEEMKQLALEELKNG